MSREDGSRNTQHGRHRTQKSSRRGAVHGARSREHAQLSYIRHGMISTLYHADLRKPGAMHMTHVPHTHPITSIGCACTPCVYAAFSYG